MNVNDIKNISVIGTGMIGPDISLLCSMYGFNVDLVGVNEQLIQRGIERLQKNLDYLVREDVLSKTEAIRIISRIKPSSDIKHSVASADLVFEAIHEDLVAKQSLFIELETHCPNHTIFASSTSGLSPGDISSNIKSKYRMLVTHFWNPPFLVPLVEIVVHEKTSADIIDLMQKFLRLLDRNPVLLKKDYLGHIGNRLQHALFREAIHLVEEGVADPEDIDKVVLSSLGPRYSMIGPMEYLDSTGIDLQVAIHSYLFKNLDDSKKPQQIIMDKYEQGDLGFKTGKGFYDWENRDRDDMVRRQNKRFIDRLKKRKSK